jgi:hypothetical protein
MEVKPMNSRQRVSKVLFHNIPDRVPLDLGATPVTGMHVSSVYQLRQALGLDQPGEPVKVSNIYQMLGEIKPDLIEALDVDVVALSRPMNSFGIANQGWKEWTTFDGTPVLVPEGFNTQPDPNGDLLIYPWGDKSATPSGRMPKDGFYFDAIVRQPPIVEDQLNVEDNLEEFSYLPDHVLASYREQVDHLYETTDKAIIANVGGTGFGDIAHVPGAQLREPKGIRDIEEWYISTVMRQDYIYAIFERQCEIALENLRRFYDAVGDRISAVFMTGTDFGGQQRLIISPNVYRKLYFPFQKKLNDWVHDYTTWKTFMHTDGAVKKLIPDFIDAGFDILNPIQWTAEGMDPQEIKSQFGEKIVCWGAGIDTQGTLPYGTPDEVFQETREKLDIFKRAGGYVFSSVHNIQAQVPVDNILAFYRAYRQYRDY